MYVVKTGRHNAGPEFFLIKTSAVHQAANPKQRAMIE